MKARKKEIFNAVQVTEEMVKNKSFPEGARFSGSSTNSDGKITSFRGVVERRWSEPEYFEIGDWLVTGKNGIVDIYKNDWFIETFEEVDSELNLLQKADNVGEALIL